MAPVDGGFVIDAADGRVNGLNEIFSAAPCLLPCVARTTPETSGNKNPSPIARIIGQKVSMAKPSPNILVVEDDRETRTLIAKYLRNNACNVTTATDGREMVARDGRPSRRSHHPRRHAARRGRPQPVPQGARGVADADHHADRARRGRRSHPRPRDGRRRLSGQSRSTRANCWRASTRCCAARPPPRPPAPSKARPRWRFAGWRIDFRAARIAQSGRRARRDDQRRVRPAADVLRAARPRAVARQPARPHARPQRRLVRALDRRAGQPHPPQDRARSAGCHHDQDGALRRLYVHAKSRSDR